MNRRLTRIAVSLALGLGTTCVLPSAASANTVTIGSDLSQPRDANSCLAPCLAVQQAQAGGSNPFPLTSPANGTVTSWAIRSSDNVTNAFRILRPTGSNTYMGVGTSLGVDPDILGLVRYEVSLPIKQGDAIGIQALVGTDSDFGVPEHDTPGVPSNVWALNAMGAPADGTTATFAPEAGHELLLQATVKFCLVPQLHKLKKKNAKRLLAAADCGVKVKKKETHKKKFRGKVLKQKKAAGSTFPPGTVVPIVIGKKD